MTATSNSRNFSLKILFAFFVIATAAFHLGNALKHRGFYRDIHLGTALHYAATKIDLPNTIIVGFNATNTPTIQEFPLWQAAAGLAFKVLGTWEGWANAVSLIFLFTGFYPLFQLTKARLGDRVAWWTLILFITQPLVFVQSGTAATDGMSIAVAIWFWYFALRLLEKPTWMTWAVASLLGALSAATKLPFFAATGLAVFFVLLKDHRAEFRRWLALGSVGAVSAVLFFAWTKCTDNYQKDALFAFVDLRLSNPEMVWWYFGDWAYRLSPKYWIRGGWWMANVLFGGFMMIALLALGWRQRGNSAFAKFGILGGALVTLVFSHLVLTHSHYYLMFSAPVAILSAQAVAAIEEKFRSAGAEPSGRTAAVAGIVLALGLGQGLIGMRLPTHYDTYPDKITQTLQKYTVPSDKLLIQGGGWGGDALFHAKRNGLSIWNAKMFENAETFDKLKSLGYNKLVMISESPVMTAIKQVVPGQGDVQREVYGKFSSPVIESWPTLYQSADILIKEIPQSSK